MELAKECKKLLSFTHVSTAYVNANKSGFIEEKIYDLPGVSDPEEEIARIQKLSPQFISENEMKLIHNYPNTYTFTKSMAERMLKKKSGSLKLTIIRPSIIISCYEEPCPGWTETLSAAGGITLTAGIGLMRNVWVNVKQILDLVPCDTVSNLILAASAATSLKPGPCIELYHASSSSKNPCTITSYKKILLAWVARYPFYKMVFEPTVVTIANKRLW